MNILRLLLIFLCVPAIAHAYIDPATGSLVLQLLSGMVVGVIIFFKRARMALSSALTSVLGIFRKNK